MISLLQSSGGILYIISNYNEFEDMIKKLLLISSDIRLPNPSLLYGKRFRIEGEVDLGLVSKFVSLVFSKLKSISILLDQYFASLFNADAEYILITVLISILELIETDLLSKQIFCLFLQEKNIFEVLTLPLMPSNSDELEFMEYEIVTILKIIIEIIDYVPITFIKEYSTKLISSLQNISSIFNSKGDTFSFEFDKIVSTLQNLLMFVDETDYKQLFLFIKQKSKYKKKKISYNMFQGLSKSLKNPSDILLKKAETISGYSLSLKTAQNIKDLILDLRSQEEYMRLIVSLNIIFELVNERKGKEKIEASEESLFSGITKLFEELISLYLMLLPDSALFDSNIADECKESYVFEKCSKLIIRILDIFKVKVKDITIRDSLCEYNNESIIMALLKLLKFTDTQEKELRDLPTLEEKGLLSDSKDVIICRLFSIFNLLSEYPLSYDYIIDLLVGEFTSGVIDIGMSLYLIEVCTHNAFRGSCVFSAKKIVRSKLFKQALDIDTSDLQLVTYSLFGTMRQYQMNPYVRPFVVGGSPNIFSLLLNSTLLLCQERAQRIFGGLIRVLSSLEYYSLISDITDELELVLDKIVTEIERVDNSDRFTLLFGYLTIIAEAMSSHLLKSVICNHRILKQIVNACYGIDKSEADTYIRDALLIFRHAFDPSIGIHHLEANNSNPVVKKGEEICYIPLGVAEKIFKFIGGLLKDHQLFTTDGIPTSLLENIYEVLCVACKSEYYIEAILEGSANYIFTDLFRLIKKNQNKSNSSSFNIISKKFLLCVCYALITGCPNGPTSRRKKQIGKYFGDSGRIRDIIAYFDSNNSRNLESPISQVLSILETLNENEGKDTKDKHKISCISNLRERIVNLGRTDFPYENYLGLEYFREPRLDVNHFKHVKNCFEQAKNNALWIDYYNKIFTKHQFEATEEDRVTSSISFRKNPLNKMTITIPKQSNDIILRNIFVCAKFETKLIVSSEKNEEPKIPLLIKSKISREAGTTQQLSNQKTKKKKLPSFVSFVGQNSSIPNPGINYSGNSNDKFLPPLDNSLLKRRSAPDFSMKESPEFQARPMQESQPGSWQQYPRLIGAGQGQEISEFRVDKQEKLYNPRTRAMEMPTSPSNFNVREFQQRPSMVSQYHPHPMTQQFYPQQHAFEKMVGQQPQFNGSAQIYRPYMGQVYMDPGKFPALQIQRQEYRPPNGGELTYRELMKLKQLAQQEFTQSGKDKKTSE